MPEPPENDDLAEPLPEFNWIERRADGLLTLLMFAVVGIDTLLLFWPMGVLLSWGVFVGGTLMAVWLALNLAGPLGRRFVGGMFLGRFLRWLFLLMLFGGLVLGVGICLVSSQPLTRG